VQGDHSLEKMNRINVLYDFYGSLLTEKQQTFLQCYFQDDYSLGEIAAEFEISRQAVYEHLKRAEQMLEDYERKLGLALRHEKFIESLNLLDREIGRLPEDRQAPLAEAAARLRDRG